MNGRVARSRRSRMRLRCWPPRSTAASSTASKCFRSRAGSTAGGSPAGLSDRSKEFLGQWVGNGGFGNSAAMDGRTMLSVHRVIAAPPAAAWNLLVDLEAWPKWGPSIASAELDETYEELTSEATGQVKTSLLVKVPFVVTDFDPGRSWAWKVAGIPATSPRGGPGDDGARGPFGAPPWGP